jgi:two-component system sensor histidine kinase SaeS
MKLRNQLLLINMLSIGLMVGALLYSYRKMYLNLEQTRLLTGIALGAGILCVLAYWLMTSPIIKSIHRLIHMAEQWGQRKFSYVQVVEEGPCEIKQLARAFQQMGEKLEKSFKQLEDGEKARRELIANVSHDLRTPIASIQSIVEALQDNLVEDQETKDRYLATIRSEIKRMGEMINDLFELSKLEAGQESFAPQWTHLDQVLVEVLDAYTIMLREKNIELEVQVPPSLPPLLIMPSKISRVLGNLLQNAIKYSPEYGRLELVVTHQQELKQVEIWLRDEGEGILPEDRVRIFERFYRTDSSRNRASGGAGLGLAIAKSLIKMHGGKIGVREREDGRKGSEFWCTLPVPDP